MKYNTPSLLLVTRNTLAGIDARNSNCIYQLSSGLLNVIMNFWHNILREFLEQVSSSLILKQKFAPRR